MGRAIINYVVIGAAVSIADGVVIGVSHLMECTPLKRQISEDEKLDAKAFKVLIKEAAALNSTEKKTKKRK